MYYNDTYLKQGNKAVVKGTETKYQLQDLTPDTVYTIKVSALSEKGEGAATRIIQAKTQPFGMFFNALVPTGTEIPHSYDIIEFIRYLVSTIFNISISDCYVFTRGIIL